MGECHERRCARALSLAAVAQRDSALDARRGGVPYKLRIFNLAKGEHKCAELLALNPLGKLPTLVHNGAVVTETAAICAYLADSFPGTVLRRRLAIRCAGLICAGWCLPSRRWKRR